jgi:hypothetical protein
LRRSDFVPVGRESFLLTSDSLVVPALSRDDASTRALD